MNFITAQALVKVSQPCCCMHACERAGVGFISMKRDRSANKKLLEAQILDKKKSRLYYTGRKKKHLCSFTSTGDSTTYFVA